MIKISSKKGMGNEFIKYISIGSRTYKYLDIPNLKKDLDRLCAVIDNIDSKTIYIYFPNKEAYSKFYSDEFVDIRKAIEESGLACETNVNYTNNLRVDRIITELKRYSIPCKYTGSRNGCRVISIKPYCTSQISDINYLNLKYNKSSNIFIEPIPSNLKDLLNKILDTVEYKNLINSYNIEYYEIKFYVYKSAYTDIREKETDIIRDILYKIATFDEFYIGIELDIKFDIFNQY